MSKTKETAQELEQQEQQTDAEVQAGRTAEAPAEGTEAAEAQAAPPPAAEDIPAIVAQLTSKGEVVITARTPDDLFTQAESVKAAVTGGRIISGAVGRNYDRACYCLQLNYYPDNITA